MAEGEAATHAASAGGHGLTKKLGPLPIWAWAAVLVGSYLLFHYLRSRNASAGAPVAQGAISGGNNAGTPGVVLGPGGQLIDATTGNVLGQLPSNGGGLGGPNTTTPQGWLAAAQGALQGLGLDNNTINGALNDFVAGQPLPQSEFNIVNEAIKIVGSAPATLGNPSLAPPATGGAPAPAPQTPTGALPAVTADLFKTIYKFGEYSPNDFTKIGTVTNGNYSGRQVSGGVPVFTGIYGGMAQGPFPTSGTYDIYIPSQYTAYESPSGTQQAA